MKKFVINGVSGAYTLPSNLSKEAIKGGISILADTTSEACVITLPPVGTYDVEIIVTDFLVNASVNNIQVLISDPTQYFESGSESVIINTVGGSVTITSVGTELYAVDGLSGWELPSRGLRFGTMIANQSSTNAPEVTVWESFGVTFTPSYVATGVYKLTSSAPLPSVIGIRCSPGVTQDQIVTGNKTGPSEITLNCYVAGVLNDNKMSNCLIELVAPI